MWSGTTTTLTLDEADGALASVLLASDCGAIEWRLAFTPHASQTMLALPSTDLFSCAAVPAGTSALTAFSDGRGRAAAHESMLDEFDALERPTPRASGIVRVKISSANRRSVRLPHAAPTTGVS